MKQPALNRRNPEHYRDGPPLWLGSTTAVRRFHTPCPCGCESRPSPPFSRRGRAAIAARCKRAVLTDCEGASPSVSTIFCRPSVGSDASRWYREERSASLRAGSILQTWRNSIRAGPRCRWAQARESANLSVCTNFAAWLESADTADSNSAGLNARAGATPAAATNAAVCGIADRAVLKTAALSGAWACKSPRPHQFFGGWWNAYTRVSETRGREPVQVRVLSRRPIFRLVL